MNQKEREYFVPSQRKSYQAVTYEKPNLEGRVLSTTNLYEIPMMREQAILDWFGNAMTTISRYGLRKNVAQWWHNFSTAV